MSEATFQVWTLNQHAHVLQMQGGIDDLTATEAMGMGSWRLKGSMDPPFEGLTAQVEGLWRHMLDRDLKLYPMDKVNFLLYITFATSLENDIAGKCRLKLEATAVHN